MNRRILWDGEHVFPEKIEKFRSFLKMYLTSLDHAELLDNMKFDYDPESDEFLNNQIQEYYDLWSVK